MLEDIENTAGTLGSASLPTTSTLPPSYELSERQYWVIEQLAQGERDIAKLGASRKTLWRWKQNPEFKRELQRVSLEVRLTLREQVIGVVDLSLSTIRREMREDNSDMKRLQAAVSVLKSFNLEKLI